MNYRRDVKCVSNLKGAHCKLRNQNIKYFPKLYMKWYGIKGFTPVVFQIYSDMQICA